MAHGISGILHSPFIAQNITQDQIGTLWKTHARTNAGCDAFAMKASIISGNHLRELHHDVAHHAGHQRELASCHALSIVYTSTESTPLH